MDYDRKTGTQLRVEITATNQLSHYEMGKTKTYKRIPYTKLFGQKFALKQWLLFSNLRVINPHNGYSDNTPLIFYLPVFIKHQFEEIKKSLPFLINELNKTKLEEKVNPVDLESV